MKTLDPRACYRALETRDERFDGRMFVGVTTTRIYCRPVCPATTARYENCRFFASAAAAQEAGFRPCLRCRPETAPDVGAWRGTSNTVSRGLSLIADGELDGDGASVEALAERLGVGARQLRRLFTRHLGASPVSVAQTRRVLFAKQLLHETRLPMTEVALAAGFGSVRRFNETFREMYQRPPSALRRAVQSELPEGSLSAAGVTVRLRYQPPYDWNAMLAHLRARAVDGVERVTGQTYVRAVRHEAQFGLVEVSHLPRAHSLAVTVRVTSVRALPGIVTRVRRVFDLGADVAAIGADLAGDPWLAPRVKARPGLRAAGGWDGFEVAARAVLGQQVSLEAGRKLASALTALCAPALPADLRAPGLTRAFPSARDVADADLTPLGVPRARREALRAVARAALSNPRLFHPRGTVDETVAALCEVPGVGDWTAHYIALRASREPDAFPAADRALLRAASACAGRTVTAPELLARAERWRPWRAYAAQHLWLADESLPLEVSSP